MQCGCGGRLALGCSLQVRHPTPVHHSLEPILGRPCPLPLRLLSRATSDANTIGCSERRSEIRTVLLIDLHRMRQRGYPMRHDCRPPRTLSHGLPPVSPRTTQSLTLQRRPQTNADGRQAVVTERGTYLRIPFAASCMDAASVPLSALTALPRRQCCSVGKVCRASRRPMGRLTWRRRRRNSRGRIEDVWGFGVETPPHSDKQPILRSVGCLFYV
jgi:hypothetical protein